MPFAGDSLRLRLAVDALSEDGVVACPTEAVWGLSCDPASEPAVARLLQLKGRPVAKGLILVAADASQFAFLLADMPQAQRDTLNASWPGPATWLVPHGHRLPPWIHGEHDTVAIRVSAHPVVRALCRAWNGPLVSTSANPAGCQPPVAAFQVRRYFGRQLDGILPGSIGALGKPTVIRDVASGRVIRA